jgi:uncharacterized tellurite resistance protein B-like protein
MSFTDFIADNGRKINRENFLHLIQIAQADGRIDDRELELLHRYGSRFSLTDHEIDKLIASEQSHIYSPPYELEKRFAQLYDAVQVMNIDSHISGEEKELFGKLAIAALFTEDVIPRLLEFILEGIREGKDEEELFEKLRKEKLLSK